MEIEIERVDQLRFADGTPVRAASAVAPWGSGYLVVQDDATHAARFDGDTVEALRLLPSVEGLDLFEEAGGTKHLKPDLEAACEVRVDGEPALLALGSGSTSARTRWSLVWTERVPPSVEVAQMAPLYGVVADALGIDLEVLNMEGACRLGDALRWFHRGLPTAGLPSGSVDLDLATAVAAAAGRADPASVVVTGARHYDLGSVDGVGLAVTDAVALPGGGILVSAAAEDSPNTRDDGPVVASALVRLVGPAGDSVAEVTPIPLVDGAVPKVEGLMLLEADERGARLLAVVDADDPQAPSAALRLRVWF